MSADAHVAAARVREGRMTDPPVVMSGAVGSDDAATGERDYWYPCIYRDAAILGR